MVNGSVIKPDEYLIDNDTEAILVIDDTEEISFECIRCGLCYKVCPLKTTYDSSKCIKCGLCSYHCPAKINKGEGKRWDRRLKITIIFLKLLLDII